MEDSSKEGESCSEMIDLSLTVIEDGTEVRKVRLEGNDGVHGLIMVLVIFVTGVS